MNNKTKLLQNLIIDTNHTGEFYEQLIESLVDFAVFTIDKEGYINSWNKGAHNLLGYTKDEAIGKHAGIFFTAKDRKNKILEREMRKALKFGRSGETGWRVKKNKSVFWERGIVFPLLDKNGQALGYTKVMRDLTKQREIESELEFQKHQYETLVENMSDVIIRLDKKLRYIFVNAAVEKLSGKSTNMFIGKYFTIIKWPKETIKLLVKHIRLAFKTKEEQIIEFSYSGEKGEQFFQCKIVPEITNGHAQSVIIISRDITERKLYDDAIKLSEERLRLANDAGQIGVWDWDIQNNKINWSEKVYDLHGITNNEFDGKFSTFSKFIHEEDKNSMFETIQSALKSKTGFSADFRVVHPNGSIRWLSTKSQIMLDKTGMPKRMLGATYDITENKVDDINTKFIAEASRILSATRDYKTALNEMAHIAVPQMSDWCTVHLISENNGIERIALAHRDPNKIKWAKEISLRTSKDTKKNPTVNRILQTGKSELVSQITEEMINSSIEDEKLRTAIHKLGFKSMVAVPIFVKGKTFGVITFISSELGRIYTDYDLSVAEDIAYRVGLSIENIVLYEETQKAVAVRDDFISIASHELKTPLTSLKMYSQILSRHLKSNPNDQSVHITRRMAEQIDKLNLLVTDLLNVSKLQLGKLELQMELFDLNELVQTTIENIQTTSEKHKIILHAKANKPALGDKDRIGQVIINLLTNAIKYSPDSNKILVSISSNKKNIKVSVKDYGIGIDSEHLDKIFGRFYRAAGRNDKSISGLGIGLYISADIVKRHNGELKVKSKKGVGSTFTFSMPID